MQRAQEFCSRHARRSSCFSGFYPLHLNRKLGGALLGFPERYPSHYSATYATAQPQRIYLRASSIISTELILFSFLQIAKGRQHCTRNTLGLLQVVHEQKVLVLVQLVIDLGKDILQRSRLSVHPYQVEGHSLVFLCGTIYFQIIVKFVSINSHFSSIKSNRRTASGFHTGFPTHPVGVLMVVRRYLCAVCLPNAPDVIHGSPGARWAK